MSGITQLKQNYPQFNQGIQTKQYLSNPGILLLSNNKPQINGIQPQQIRKIPIQLPNQVSSNQIRQAQFIPPQVKNVVAEQALHQRAFYPIQQNYQSSQQVQQVQFGVKQILPIQHIERQEICQSQQMLHDQKIQSQNKSRKFSGNFQLILPQQTIDYSRMSNFPLPNRVSPMMSNRASRTTPPWAKSQQQNSPLITHQIEKLTSPTTTNTEMTYRGTIQEIKPLDFSNYGVIQQQDLQKKDENSTDRYNQIVCHTFQNEIQNNNDSFQNNQIHQNSVLNVSFSKEQPNSIKNSPLDLQSARKSNSNSQNNSFAFTSLQNAPFIFSPQKQATLIPSSVRNSPAVKVNHFQPNLTLIANVNEQPYTYSTHKRSKSAWSPQKSNKDAQIKAEEFQFYTPIRQMISDKALNNSTPKQLNINENQYQQGIEFSPIVGKVSLQYISKNNPIPHFNDQPQHFHKSPERSKDAVSCVFFNYGNKKRPTKIKLKYTPIEQILSPDQLQEYQTKHQDLNLIQNKQETQVNSSSFVTPFKENSFIENQSPQKVQSQNNQSQSCTSQINTETILNELKSNRYNNSSSKFHNQLYANELVSSLYS